jgi:beta-xylosidase
VAERVADLLGRMTVREKAGQLVGYWAAPAAVGLPVAPMQDQFDEPPPLAEVAAAGLGHLTRVFGTTPVLPADGVRRLRTLQATVVGASRFGIPAIVHEECLAGLMAWTATVFPVPPAWGASFDPGLVTEMATAIGESMRRLGVHQGLAPVLDVTRDYRWGRTEETIGEDPYLVGVIGTAYVAGLERSGVVATLKHFAGYSTSRAARNLAPAAVGERELADLIVEPFAVALREGGARSVMHSYADVDGVPPAGDERLLTGLLRDELGFAGVVVADYFGISFLETQHRVAGSPGEAAALALRAGVDVELPTVRCYGRPLVDLVRDGTVAEELLDRAAARVLGLKCELGLLDPEDGDEDLGGEVTVDLDPPAHRDLARRLAEESVILLANDGVLPAGPGRRIAVVGPLADDRLCMVGCYGFPNHVGSQHPGLATGVEIPTLAESLATVFADLQVVPADLTATGDPADAVAAARDADLCVVAVGDRSGIFGRGTSGEGCDAETLALPGRQAEFARTIMATGTPTVLVVISGRPYALGEPAPDAAAVLQAFLPGEEGAGAIAGIITGRVAPSGRLPMSIPHSATGQPGTYLRSPLAGPNGNSSVAPAHAFPFGHGLTWTTFHYSDLHVDAVAPTDGAVRVSAVLRNTGRAPGTEVVQLYLADPVASVVRPEGWLAGFARVHLEPGAAARVEFTVHADRTSFTGRDLRRIVEPGRIDVAIGPSSAELPLHGEFTLTGQVRVLDRDRVHTVPVDIVAL